MASVYGSALANRASFQYCIYIIYVLRQRMLTMLPVDALTALTGLGDLRALILWKIPHIYIATRWHRITALCCPNNDTSDLFRRSPYEVCHPRRDVIRINRIDGDVGSSLASACVNPLIPNFVAQQTVNSSIPFFPAMLPMFIIVSVT